MDHDTFNELADLALKGSGQLIPSTKAYLVEARLSAIARRESFSTMADLVGCLKARPNPTFEAEIIAALVSHHTDFFRHREGLQHIVSEIIPARVRSDTSRKIRIWCAGGASGQEAYSLAMLLAESDDSIHSDTQIDIVSTDVCQHMTERGRAGHYGHFEVQRGLSIHRLLRHFKRQETEHWQISNSLRAQISFRTHNLLEDMSGLGEFDVILCRNVLGGMARSVQRSVAEHMGAQLAKDGLLLLTPGESLTGITENLQPNHDIRGGFISMLKSGAHKAA